MKKEITKPMYKSAPTVREYEEYLLECEYAKGWNAAMDFIFGIDREREKIKKSLIVI